jgi:cobalamin biosynthetic protein CobC
MLEHGGRLREAARHYGIALKDWIDLSTAINPQGYVPPSIPADAWLRLPENDDGLEAAAAAYYGNANLLPLPGSQAAIQTLPRIFSPHRVAVLAPGYGEHVHAWRVAGHEVEEIAADQLEAAASRCRTLVLCNPNNPDATRIPSERLLALARQSVRLVIDEAFVDAEPEGALTPLAGTDAVSDLIVLRSLGKFFGLAGARVGFAFAAPAVLAMLNEAIGPWAVSGPSRQVAIAALNDTDWHMHTRQRLAADSARLFALLAPLGDRCSQPLFVYVQCADAAQRADFFAQRGILVRHFDNALPALRFGLPGNEPAWQRLAAAINEWRTQ